eukprot:scaffold49041_cov76-Phaeocystis_antarctica.AAC.1
MCTWQGLDESEPAQVQSWRAVGAVIVSGAERRRAKRNVRRFAAVAGLQPATTAVAFVTGAGRQTGTKPYAVAL